jgi:hypothetical protein
MAYMRQTVGMGSIAWGTRAGVGQFQRLDRGYSELPTPWSWMYYPPPYDFADPNPTIPPPTFIAPAEEMGLGCAGGCNGTCAGCAGHAHGMGQLFSSGLDLSGWGYGEWGIVALGAFALYSVFFTSKAAVSTVSKASRSRASRARRKAALQAELGGL